MDRTHIRFQWASLGIGLLLLGIKFVAFRITGSNAIYSDAMESIVNVVAGAFALYSLILAARPRDADHPYGHGKVEFISAGIEGAMVLMAGVLIIIEAVQSLLSGHSIEQIDTGIALTCVAGAINYALGLGSEWHGRRIRSEALVASGHHLRTDAYTSAGLVVGLVVVRLTGLWWIDSVVGIAFAIYIVIMGLRVLRTSVAGIMDESDFTVIDDVAAFLESQRRPQWVDVHNLRMIRFGQKLHLDCHLTLPWYMSVEEAHHEVDLLEQHISDHYGAKVEMFVHTDPCIPTSCAGCALMHCPQRKAPFSARISWKRDNVMLNRKHGAY
jgi:cation diffusion facilitator family transporter